ncbi:uncharacterized protein EV420DRAFT_1511688 [Desarmillaria tabescens]|uniref:Uncharacterized protein n=1 Tax=Armillaria tabescens TaxID=1929756 RepID=A0AA39T5T6_ARMTA|nr:uncharacterized protein EV420DRAFT_1511688 [Desarmillaria tabescens]KAK0466451.1 hypothetical protein EV420DRAFT_1511688 [Desarmillaria tabescens]
MLSCASLGNFPTFKRDDSLMTSALFLVRKNIRDRVYDPPGEPIPAIKQSQIGIQHCPSFFPATTTSACYQTTLSITCTNITTSMTSIATIRFCDVLQKPPADRPRKAGTVYPMVAQLKGGTDRNSFDLLWAWEALSAVTIELEIPETEDSRAAVVKKTLMSCHQSLVGQLGERASRLLGSSKFTHGGNSFLAPCPHLCTVSSSASASIAMGSAFSSYSSSMSTTGSED